MSLLLAAAELKGPHIDWAALSPLLAPVAGAIAVLLVGLLRARAARVRAVPALTLIALGATIGLTIWQWDTRTDVIAGALAIDGLTLTLLLLFCAAAIATVLLAWRGRAPIEAGQGEFHSLLLATVFGMAVLAASRNLVALFLGYELLSIPLYVLCATEMRRAGSLESGLKYLVVGSVGSATLLYGLAMIYGATGSTSFDVIARAITDQGILNDPLLLVGIALSIVGLAFKASIAPFHQWTPDVYEGAPTPVTAFMAVATKAAALGIFLRLFGDALISAQMDWAPMLAALATVTIVVGNVGAIGQSSLKRLLGYSGVAQAGYMLGGVVIGTRGGVEATIFYLLVYMLMNTAAFAAIVARERERPDGDDIRAFAGIGTSRPWISWPMTIAMFALAGIPATSGFVGKFNLISALVSGNYAWLGIVIVGGSMISLVYYLRVIAVIWMRAEPGAAPVAAGAGAAAPAGSPPVAAGAPPIAGGSPEADEIAAPPSPPVDGGPSAAAAPRAPVEVLLTAAVCGAATIFFGIVPGPLFDLVGIATNAFSGLVA